MKKFDLNIEKILENWEIHHAIREIITNALDETMLSKCSKDIEIFRDNDNKLHIRDYGRGLKIENFTQKENDEKLKSQHVIGKFGIGLKDALATFERKNIRVFIKSKYGEIELGRAQKYGFDDVVTLHAYISPATDLNFVGTEFILIKVSEDEIQKAKNLFLKFSTHTVFEKTKYGEVLSKKDITGSIYINGVKVAEEENFLFSYNITNITVQIKKALNRERTNVGRTAYTPSIKSILLACKTKEVAGVLVQDLKEYSSGDTHDELKWIDVQEHAVKLLNGFEKVIFVTNDQRETGTDIIEEARQGGFQIITIPINLQQKIQGQTDLTGNSIMDFSKFHQERNENFKFQFVLYENLLNSEKEIYDTTKIIFDILGVKSYNLKKIMISETMQKDDYTYRPAEGVWDALTGRIIIKRTALANKERFIAIFLHELAHCNSGASDLTRAFESELTRYLGLIGNKIII